MKVANGMLDLSTGVENSDRDKGSVKIGIHLSPVRFTPTRRLSLCRLATFRTISSKFKILIKFSIQQES